MFKTIAGYFSGLFTSNPSANSVITNSSGGTTPRSGTIPFTVPQSGVYHVQGGLYQPLNLGQQVLTTQQQQINLHQQHLTTHNQALMNQQLGGVYPYGIGSLGKLSTHKPTMNPDGTIKWERIVEVEKEFTNFKECFEASEEFRTQVKTFMSSKTFNDDLKALIEEPKDEQ